MPLQISLVLLIVADDGILPEVGKYAEDWPLPNQDYNNSRAALKSPITSGNVKDLGVAWSFHISGIETFGGAASNLLILKNTHLLPGSKSRCLCPGFQDWPGQMEQ
jgi:hypothetical protein